MILPVHTDHTQSHYWSRAAHDIHPNKDIAENLPKQPDAPCQVSHYGKGHHDYSHRKISYSQRYKQIVGRLSEFLHDAHRNNDQSIPHHSDRSDGAQHHPNDHSLSQVQVQSLLLPERLITFGLRCC